MKFIICGAGQVGTSIARHLAAEENDVVVIDQSPELIGKIGDSLDVQGIVGFASHPEVLERAGAADADMLIAVTKDDEINMVACQVAHSLFNVPTKIARVRHQSYLDPAWGNLFSRDHMAIDVIISPEIEIARAIARRLQAPGSFEMIPLVDGKVRVIGVRCAADCPVINTPLRQLTGLFPDLNIAVLVILRQGRPLFVSGESQMLAGDDGGRTIQIVDAVIAEHGLRIGLQADVAVGLDPVDLGRSDERARIRRLVAVGRRRAIVRRQRIGIERRVAAGRPRMAARDIDALVLLPLDTLLGLDIERTIVM